MLPGLSSSRLSVQALVVASQQPFVFAPTVQLDDMQASANCQGVLQISLFLASLLSHLPEVWIIIVNFASIKLKLPTF